MVTMPVGTKLDVALWVGEEKVMISAIVVTCCPQIGSCGPLSSTKLS